MTRCIIDELLSSHIQGDQMEGESGFSRSIIDELHSWIYQEIKFKEKVVLPEVTLMKFILGI